MDPACVCRCACDRRWVPRRNVNVGRTRGRGVDEIDLGDLERGLCGRARLGGLRAESRLEEGRSGLANKEGFGRRRAKAASRAVSGTTLSRGGSWIGPGEPRRSTASSSSSSSSPFVVVLCRGQRKKKAWSVNVGRDRHNELKAKSVASEERERKEWGFGYQFDKFIGRAIVVRPPLFFFLRSCPSALFFFLRFKEGK
jgi:hypothetical protein